MIDAIWSGGQDGADLGGLIAGVALGLVTGGFAPLGWQTAHGPDPSLAEYGLIEADEPGYDYRTKLNVEHTDGTLLFVRNLNSPGSKLTMNLCRVDGVLGPKGRPLFILEWDKDWEPTRKDRQAGILPYSNRAMQLWVGRWVEQHQIKTLNVAGNRESVAPGIGLRVVEFLMETFG